MTGRHPLGVKRLDELLGGGLADAAFALVHGPPFLGKDALWRRYVLEGCRLGEPAVVVLTDRSAIEARRALLAADAAFGEYDDKGMVRFVDAYSRTIGAADDVPGTEYLDGAMNLNGLTVAVNNAEREFIKDHAAHRVVVDSLSTVVTYTNAATAFRFLQVLIGRTRLAGATGLLLLNEGMHAEAEVQMLKHLVDGAVELRTEDGTPVLRVQGLGIGPPTDWIEYRHDAKDFELVGGLAGGRIR